VSIVRVGLSETEKFAEGWEAIFGKKEGAKRESGPKKAKGRAAKKAKGPAAKKAKGAAAKRKGKKK
jgi:hypothetical protein